MAVWTHTSHSGKKNHSNQVQPASYIVSSHAHTYLFLHISFVYCFPICHCPSKISLTDLKECSSWSTVLFCLLDLNIRHFALSQGSK